MEIQKDKAMLIDIQYIKPNKREGLPDYLYIIWKDLDTNQKHLQVIPEPRMDIYFEKPEFRNHDYNKTYAKIEECNKVNVKYKDIIYAIAEDMGDIGKQKLNNYFTTGNYKGLKEFLIYPYVYGADYDIRAWYRYKWLEQMHNDRVKPITKGFLDIEVDSLEAVGFPQPEEHPIDLVTIIDATSKQVYTFALIGVDCVEKEIDSTWSQEDIDNEMERRAMYKHRMEEQAYYAEHIDEIKKSAHEMFDENYPGFEYNFYLYKNELKMINHIFQLIHSLKLDFLLVWNISFDIPYFIDRIRVLGGDPKEIMCHPDFPSKECYFKEDKINFAVKNKADFAHISDYTIYACQMRMYAATRKGQSELRSNRLNYIAEKEIGDEKLDYSEDGNIKTVSYRNWLRYILYNIKDVLLQYGIENVVEDVDRYYMTSYQNMTPYENEFKQTVKLRNVQYESFMSQGLVTGENVAGFLFNEERESDDSDDDEEKPEDSKFEGALVGNPLLIKNFGMKLFGKRTNSLFRYSVDFDMSAFYPSTIRAMNIDPSTLIFKVIIPADQFNVRGGDLPFRGITDVQIGIEKDSFNGDIAKEIMDNFQTRNIISTAKKWLNLPGIVDLYKELKRRSRDLETY